MSYFPYVQEASMLSLVAFLEIIDLNSQAL